MSELEIAGISSLTAVDEEQLVTMTVDQQLFGIPILSVQDIVEPEKITPVPLASSAIAGVLNLRGRIVTVIDLGVCLGAAPRDLDDHPMSVTVEHRGDLYTFLVDSIGDVRSLPRRDLDKPPQTLDPRMRRLCSGVFRLQDDLLAVLDVEKILDPATIEEAPKRKRLRKSKIREKQPLANKDTTPSSLYDRIGGEAAIDGLVDLMYQRIMSDQNLMPFFESVDMDQQMKSMRTFLAHSFGGPQEYKGQEMGTAHWNISIEKGLNHSHFTAMGSYIADSLNQMGLSVELIDEVMAIIENLRGEIIHH